jgi:hypothetical protein
MFALPGCTPSAWKSRTSSFILGKTPRKNKLIIPVKLVLKAKQTATGKLKKLKARVVARSVLEIRRIKKTKVAHQQHVLQLRQDIAEGSPSEKPNVQPVDTPQPFEDNWPPVHLKEGSNSSYQPLVQPGALLKVLTILVPTSKPKSLAATS